MDDLTMWSLLVGFVTPLLVSLLEQPRWSNAVRATIATLACLALGTGTAWFTGDLTGRTWVSAVLVVLVAALSTYQGLWKPTGLAPALERATSPSHSVRHSTA